jgi:hypothetical protein
MDLTELQDSWRKYDKKLETLAVLTDHALTELKRQKARSTVRRLTFSPITDLLSGVLATLLVGSFLVSNFSSVGYAIPALALHLFALAMIAASARQLVYIAQLDYGESVVVTQAKLAQLKAFRLFKTKWFLLLLVPLWTPFAIVAAKALFDVDAYAAFGLPVILLNLLVGIAIIPFAIWIARRFGPSLQRWPMAKRLTDAIAGADIKAALGKADEISVFNSER